MYSRLEDVLAGRENNYMLPFYWQHGDHTDTIPEEVRRIYDSGARAFCVESRPHRDFCGAGWWRDMDIILSEAEKLGMKVWILDDDHFPTGHANGKIAGEHPELRKWMIAEKHVDVSGPLNDAMILADETNAEHILLGAYAYRRVPTGKDEFVNDCDPDSVAALPDYSGRFAHFSVPEGCWRIFFLYKTRRGSDKPEYIDMLREESVKVLVDEVYESHYAHYGRYFGSTIAGFFSDEPCMGNGWFGSHLYSCFYDNRVGLPGVALPWNDRISEMMKETLGEGGESGDILPSLYALWFGFGPRTGAIRHAYMDAVTKLYRDCFTRSLGDWCEAHGVMYIGHIIEDMNSHARLGVSSGHYFRSLDGQHMSGIDIVLHQLTPGLSDYDHNCSASGNNADSAFYENVLGQLAASFARIGTQTGGRAMCEVFGAYGWAEGTQVMKWLLDFLLVRGVNHFVPHAFSPAFPDPDCPPHFGVKGLDPQFEGFTALMKYGNAAAHLLSGGERVTDAAVLYHAEAEWMNRDGELMFTQVPAKILYDNHILYDILPADCFVDGTGSRVYRAEAQKGRLKVGNASYKYLVVPYAEMLPEALLEALKSIEAQGVPVIRMEKDSGAGFLLGKADAAAERDITVEGDFPQLRIFRTVSDGFNVCMLFNESTDAAADTRIRFAGAEGVDRCTVLDLLNGEKSTCPMVNGAYSTKLEPYRSEIIIFPCSGCEKEARPSGNDDADATFPGRTVWDNESAVPADFDFSIEAARYDHPDGYSLLEAAVPCGKLFNVNAADRDPAFSGKLRYKTVFKLPGTVRQAAADGERIAINFGDVGQTVKLTLNGAPQGIRICPPYRFDVTDSLKDGENALTAEVANTLANAVRDPFSAFMAIPASGLTGPVAFIRGRREKI